MTDAMWAHVRVDATTGAPTPHLLDDHLNKVAELAGRFADGYGKEWAHLAGLWHDLGKFRHGFQRYIRQANNVDAHIEGRIKDRDKTHSAAGALWAEHLLTERFGPQGQLMARVLQYLIAGHHAGLDNWDGGLAARLAGDDARKEFDEALAQNPPNAVLRPESLALLLKSAPLGDEASRADNYAGHAGWTSADITVTTDADQTPIAPGYKVFDQTRGGRRTARFVTEAPILQYFSIQSARYAVRSERYQGIDLSVYYDPQHGRNVARMLRALEASLDYYQANFSPYQFRQARIVEFPDYAQFAQSFAGTFPWSEGLGFIADYRDPTRIDLVTYVAAHEFAHQWWAHQIVGADQQGATVLSETLAQYSALRVMRRLYGPDQIRKFLKYELDGYLRSRGGEVAAEQPLEKVEDQGYIHYRKGSLVMYRLADEIGEDAVNRALRSLLAKYAFKAAPYPTALDLVAALRAQAGADKQDLITDLFEKITLYDVKATAARARRRADGRYDVALTVKAAKFHADGRGRETPAPMNETVDVGLFTARPAAAGFGPRQVMALEKRPIRSGAQTLRFVTATAPRFAGVDPYDELIDRHPDDHIVPVR